MKLRKSATAIRVLITVLFFVLGSIGYTAQTAPQEAGAAGIKEKTAQALQAISKYTADQRDKAVSKAKEVLNDLDNRIDGLQSQLNQKWDRMNQSARTKARETLVALQKQRTAVAEWYGGLQHSSRSAWEDVKTGFLNSYHQLQHALDKASGEF